MSGFDVRVGPGRDWQQFVQPLVNAKQKLIKAGLSLRNTSDALDLGSAWEAATPAPRRSGGLASPHPRNLTSGLPRVIARHSVGELDRWRWSWPRSY
jgi:hypothetical protein